jgi:hypothetical protein
MIWAYVGGAAVLVGFGAGWTVHSWKADSERARGERAAALQLEGQQRGVHEASTRYQAGVAEIQVRERVVTKEVERVLEKPVYREQCLDDDGMRLLADDIESANARRGLGPALPSVSSAGR